MIFCIKANTKVAVLGASGGIGQPLSLLLKINPLIHELAMYDVLYSPGVAADLSHVATPCKVTGYGPGQIKEALEGADVVICAAGVPRKAGQSRDDQFNVNSRIVKDIAVQCSMINPNAIYGIVTNPINSTVPLFCEMFKKAGVLDENKILGITTLGPVRVSSYISKEKVFVEIFFFE
jgi:malate dehydrogenase